MIGENQLYAPLCCARGAEGFTGEIREKVSPKAAGAAQVRGSAGEREAFTCVRQIGEYMTIQAEANALGPGSSRLSIAPFPLRCARKTARVYPSRSMKAAAGSGDGAERRERLGGGRPLRSLRFCALLLRASARSGVSLVKASQGASRGRPRVCDVLSHLPPALPRPPPPLEPDWIRSEAASSESNQTLAFFTAALFLLLIFLPAQPRASAVLLFITANKTAALPRNPQTFAESRRKQNSAIAALRPGDVTASHRSRENRQKNQKFG